MSTVTFTRAVAPILKIRAALRERMSRPAAAAANVVHITDTLMLGWAESEVETRKAARKSLEAINAELRDLKTLVTALAEREVSPLERLLVFTKLESAAGMTRHCFNTLALASLALVIWVAVSPDEDRDDFARAPRSGSRIVRTMRRAREDFWA